MQPSKQATPELDTLRKVAKSMMLENAFFVVVIAVIYGGLAISEEYSLARLSDWFVVASAIGAFVCFALQGLFRVKLTSSSDKPPPRVQDEWLRRAGLLRRAPLFVAPLVVSLVINVIIAHLVLSLVFTALIVLCQMFLLLSARVIERRVERIASPESTA